MTTMSENKTLNHYLTAWNLSNPQLLTQTATSHIYTVARETETVILKLLSPSETDEQRGAVALRCFDGHGAVRLLRSDDGAQLLEYAAGNELITLVERGEDENATRVIAQVLRQLHSVPQDVSQDGLFTLERWFAELFNKAAADKAAGVESIYVRCGALRSPGGCWTTRAIRACCTATSITATSGSPRAAGWPSTRKGWSASAPTIAPTRSATRPSPNLPTTKPAC
jgi:hypothetical protein